MKYFMGSWKAQVWWHFVIALLILATWIAQHVQVAHLKQMITNQSVWINTLTYNVAEQAKQIEGMSIILHNKKLEKLHVHVNDGGYGSVVLSKDLSDFIVTNDGEMFEITPNGKRVRLR